MKIFVITNTYQGYLDFLKYYRVSERDFIWLDSPDKIRGHRNALCVEWGILPENYEKLVNQYLIPYEAILITMKQALSRGKQIAEE